MVSIEKYNKIIELEVSFNLKDGTKSEKFFTVMCFNSYQFDLAIFKITCKPGQNFPSVFDSENLTKSVKSIINVEVIKDKRIELLEFLDLPISTISHKGNYIEVGIKGIKMSVTNQHSMSSSIPYFVLNNNASILLPSRLTSTSANGEWKDDTYYKSFVVDGTTFCLNRKYYYSQFEDDGSLNNVISSLNCLTLMDQPKVDFASFLYKGDIFFIIASLYAGVTLSYTQAYYNEDGRTWIILKTNKTIPNTKKNKILNFQFIDIYGFLENVKIGNEKEWDLQWWQKNINKVVTASYLDGESKFLILYNVIEQIFDLLKKIGRIEDNKSQKYFTGMTTNKNEIKKLCRELVNEIKKFIPEKSEHQQERKQYCDQNSKISFKENILLNKRNLKEKIQLVFSKLDLEPSFFGVDDVKGLVKVRNQIVHPEENTMHNYDIEKYNVSLLYLANICLLTILCPDWKFTDVVFQLFNTEFAKFTPD